MKNVLRIHESIIQIFVRYASFKIQIFNTSVYGYYTLLDIFLNFTNFCSVSNNCGKLLITIQFLLLLLFNF